MRPRQVNDITTVAWMLRAASSEHPVSVADVMRAIDSTPARATRILNKVCSIIAVNKRTTVVRGRKTAYYWAKPGRTNEQEEAQEA